MQVLKTTGRVLKTKGRVVGVLVLEGELLKKLITASSTVKLVKGGV